MWLVVFGQVGKQDQPAHRPSVGWKDPVCLFLAPASSIQSSGGGNDRSEAVQTVSTASPSVLSTLGRGGLNVRRRRLRNPLTGPLGVVLSFSLTHTRDGRDSSCRPLVPSPFLGPSIRFARRQLLCFAFAMGRVTCTFLCAPSGRRLGVAASRSFSLVRLVSQM